MSDGPQPRAITTYLTRQALTDSRVMALTGDASDRRYYRVVPRSGNSFVLALHTQPFPPGSLPFVNVAALFAAMPLPVPRVRDEAADLGILAIDDLGDITLQAHVAAAPTAAHMPLYERAVDYLVLMQQRGRELASDRFLPYSLAFDVTKLMWEMDFFLQHFLEGFRSAIIGPAARSALRAQLSSVVEELASEPRVLCHRDYHSRNLMVVDDDLFIIDFQDARLGPNTYDLVSLLRDSYVDLPESSATALIERFRQAAGLTEDAGTFRARFDLMAVQRNLKALGTFGYQAVARNNLLYAQYVPRTLDHVRRTLATHARFGELRNLLTDSVPELA